MATVIEEARASHLLYRQYATALRYQFQIPREAAQEIVCSCLQGAHSEDQQLKEKQKGDEGRQNASGIQSFPGSHQGQA